MKKCVFLLLLGLVLLCTSLFSDAQEQEVSESDALTALAKEFVEILAREDFAGAVKNFDSTMKAVLPEEKLREAWKSLIAQVGPFKRQNGIRTEKWLQYDIVFVTCEFEKSVLDVKVVFNSKKQISGLWFVPSQPQEVPKSDDLIVLAKEFVELLAEEDFAGAVKDFDSTMKEGLPAEKLGKAWKSRIAKVGPFKREIGIRTEKFLQHDIVFVTCEFEKSVLDVKVVFNSKKQITGLWFVPSQPLYKPPTYAKPDSFREKEVQVGTGEWALPATLTIPVGDGPFPAVVLVHGSGTHDRDETIGPNKPFRDLAWGLASKGIAVLRYEKRTKVHFATLLPISESITVKEETIDDALEAASLLRRTEKIDAKKIYVLGHSLGGMLIPRMAPLDPEIAGFIVMAGTTRPLEDVILEQMTYIFSLDGNISESEKAQLEKIKLWIAKMKDPTLSETAPSADLPLGTPPKYWLDLRGYHPPEVGKSIKQPMLILQGGRDYQVTMEDFLGWKKALSSRKNVEFRLYPKLNHLFIEGEGKITPAEYLTSGNVAVIVIDDIANWIKKQ